MPGLRVLLGYTEVPVGVSVGLVLAMVSLPLLAATVPPLLAASAAMRRLELRLRAWAQAEPVPEPGGSA